MIETRCFRIEPGRYVRQAASIWLGRWWWTLALPVAVLLVLGTSDPRWYIVAMAMLLIVAPGILALVYFNHALRPEAAMAVLSHTVCLDADGITLTYPESEDYKAPGLRRIPAADIRSVEDTGTSMLIHLRSSNYDYIEIPAGEFGSGDFAKALQLYTHLA